MRIVSGGHLKPDRTIDIREVMLHLDQLRDARCRIDTFNNVKAGRYEVSEDYLSIITGTVTAGLVALPHAILDLEWGLGLYQVGPTAELEEAYGIVPAGHIALMKGTAALERASKGYCWLVAGNIYFKNVENTTGVTIWYVPTSKSVAEGDTYPVPPDVEAELLQQLVQMFGIQQQAPHDELEDGQK